MMSMIAENITGYKVLVLSNLFEYPCYGSMAIRNILFLLPG